MAREPNGTAKQRANDPPLLILTSLASGPKHGHALSKDIEGFAGVVLGPGALYGAITRLEERGLIEPLESDDRRRPYRISAAGSAYLSMQWPRCSGWPMKVPGDWPLPTGCPSLGAVGESPEARHEQPRDVEGR